MFSLSTTRSIAIVHYFDQATCLTPANIPPLCLRTIRLTFVGTTADSVRLPVNVEIPVLIHRKTVRPVTLVATSATGQTNCRLFRILDTISHRWFLVDTGAESSLIPPTHRHSTPQDHGFTLQAANGASIPVFVRQSLTLNLGFRRKFQWVFVVADVKQPILGADFLNHFNLLVDLKCKHLIDSNTRLQVQGMSISTQSPLHPV